MLRTSSLFFVCLLFGGCAAGNRHDYSSALPETSLTSPTPVAVAVHDRRPFIVNGDKQPHFTGVSRGGFGNPFNVSTASGKPLADDFRSVIVGALKRNGVSVKEVIVPPQENNGRDAVVKLRQRRSLLLTVNLWKTDTYMATLLGYDLQLTVFDLTGNILADKRFEGTDNLGTSAWNPPSHAREVVPIAYKKRLEEMLASPEVKQALR